MRPSGWWRASTQTLLSSSLRLCSGEGARQVGCGAPWAVAVGGFKFEASTSAVTALAGPLFAPDVFGTVA